MLFEYFQEVSQLMPNAQKCVTAGTSNPHDFKSTMATFEDFLSQQS
jgi:hypothetical protein